MLYEGRNVLSDKPVVVLDIGHAYTKCGFAGEAAPRCIVPSEVKCSSTNKMKKVFDYKHSDELYNTMVDFVHVLYFRHLLVSPKDRKVVIVESLLCPTIERETLAKVLFQHYDVASVLMVPSHQVSLYTLAVPTALVLDLGYKEAVLIPVVEGIPVLPAYQALALGGEAVDKSLRLHLEDQPKEEEIIVKAPEPLPDNVIEDIKVRACFVTTLERAQMIQASQKESSVSPPPPPPSVKYPLRGERILNVPGSARECAYEVLFEMDNDLMSVPSMVLDAILQCPVDTRVVLAENILVIGGTSMATGFKARLQQELQDLLMTPQYLARLALKRFCFHTPPGHENYIGWLGAAILGATNTINKRSLSREVFLKQQRLPDWSDLSFNAPGSKKG